MLATGCATGVAAVSAQSAVAAQTAAASSVDYTQAMKSFTADASGDQLAYAVNGELKDVAYQDTPVGRHGKLSIGKAAGFSAPTVLDEHGQPFQLRGASTHGVQWFPQYINREAFQSLRDEWGINMVRLALYPREGGYLQGSQAKMDAKIGEAVNAANELGMYVILDWHVLNYNPNGDADKAEEFFIKYATKYKNLKNVLYEIDNEPTSTSWYDGSGNDLYTYSKRITKAIRATGNQSVVICGTNTWSQDVDAVAAKPLSADGISNVAYTLHFYAGTHYDNIKNKLRTALAAGTPVFVSEFGITDASGWGGIDIANANDWMTLLTRNNISYAAWSLCNKGEGASFLKESTGKTSKWTGSELSTSGIWLVNTSRRIQAMVDGVSQSGGSGTGETPTDPTPDPMPDPTPDPMPDPTPSEPTDPTTPTDPTEPSDPQTTTTALTVEAKVSSDWEMGANVNVTVSNPSDATYKGGWKVEFDLAGTITNLWCGKVVSHTGNHYVVSDASWNASIAPKQSTSFGFGVSKTPTSSALPTNLTVNDVAAGASGDSSKVSGSTDSSADSSKDSSKDSNDQKTSDDQKTDSSDTKPADTKPSDGQPSDGQSSDAKPAASALTAEAKVNSNWAVGATVQVVVNNKTDAVHEGGWTIAFDLDGDITNLWNGTIASHKGNHYVITNASWNGTIAAKQNATFGFTMSKSLFASAEPTNVTVR